MKAIYLTGPDGCGKTTYLSQIEEHLSGKGFKTRHIWIRSPKKFSKPLMAFCRLAGLTKYFYVNDVKYGAHHFYKSKFVSWLFPILQLIDFNIKWFITKSKIQPDEIVLFDRFALDTLCDLMVSTRRFSLHKNWIGKYFISLIPPNSKTIMLMVDEEVIRSRKKDTLYDENLGHRIAAFRIIAQSYPMRIIMNNGSMSEVRDELFNYLELYEWV